MGKRTSVLPAPLARLRNLFTLDITRIYETLAADHGDRPLLAPPSPLEYPGYGDSELTGRQIRDLGHRIANALRANGVTTNTRVVIAKRDHPDYLLYLYSTIAAGAVPVSVNAGTGWEFAAAVARRAGAHFLVSDPETLEAPGGAEHVGGMLAEGTTVFTVGTPRGADKEKADGAWWAGREGVVDFVGAVTAAPTTAPPRRRIGTDTPLALFHTSGTTGVPKLCIWSRRNTYRIWKPMMPMLPVTSGSRAMLAVPFSHQIAFALGTAVLLCGTRVSTASLYDPRAALRKIEEERVNCVMAFPHLYMRMAGENLGEYDLSSMRVWSVGADKAHAAHIAALTRHGSLRLPGRPRGSVFLDSYGSTEIGAGGIMQAWLPGDVPEPCVQGKPIPTQFGVRIVDEDWQPVPTGAPGRILVRSSSHFDGYWDDHTRWAESRIDGWWWGGDIGRVDRKGRLVFLDREVDSVRTDAGVLHTLPVEERLLRHPRAMEAAVFSAATNPHTGIGRAEAWVVPKGVLDRADLAALDAADLLALEKELLALAGGTDDGPPLSAVRVVALEQIPIGVTGKVLKRRLRELTAAENVHGEGEQHR